MTTLHAIWWVGGGGVIGTLLRFYLGKWIAGRTGSAFPWGTWIINLSGSFILGVLAAMDQRNAIPAWVWLMCGIGFCGAYTTFSTFGYEAQQLLERGKWARAAAYIVGTVVFGLLMAWCGIRLG
jgi:CrcB protein